MKPVIIIPARFKSSRFEGKPLALINGKAMIMHVYERCIKALPPEDVYVGTDDERISSFCKKNSIAVVMTSPQCLTGTDRVYEASLSITADLYINVQGDEPMVDHESISEVIEAAKKTDSVVNAMSRISNPEEYFSPSIPKIITSLNNDLLYMS
jgi:3-deoxy-manno-octulosonate cytidylyltransferase (CMP-KDO synthetase)